MKPIRFRLFAFAVFVSAVALNALDAEPAGDPVQRFLEENPDIAFELQQAFPRDFDPPASLAAAEGRRFRTDIFSVEPGAAAYSRWGHTALRIYDARDRRDYVFDYGRFIFDDRFLERFMKNQPAYELGVMMRELMFRFYARYENRRVYAQQLFLTDAEAEALLLRLLKNYRADQREYLYHHYRDNCTTRIRDIVNEYLDGALERASVNKSANSTFRRTASAYLADDPPYWLVVDVIQGVVTDESISIWQEMFLPLNFMRRLDEFRSAEGAEGRLGPIVLALDNVEPRSPPQRAQNWIFTALLYAALCIAPFYLTPALRRTSGFWLKTGALARHAWRVGAGSLGFILLTLWFGTNHDSLDWNLNVFAFSPLALFAPLAERLFCRGPQRLRAKLMLNLACLALPAIGLLLALTRIWPQSSWVFLGVALLIEGLIFLRLYKLAGAAGVRLTQRS